MKKKVLLSSIATIALCLCLIAGSTFALFTDSTNFNIAVTSGDVEIKSTATVVNTYSAVGPVAEHDDIYLKDEHDHYYEHVAQDVGKFLNGGTAVVDTDGTVVIGAITPGDKVEISIDTENFSDIALRFRYTISVIEEGGLETGMVLTTHSDEVYEAVKSFTSEWFDVVEPGAAIDSKVISLELPVYAGNEYQSEYAGNIDENGNVYAEDDIKSVKYQILVEAVQGNAVTTENETFVLVYPTQSSVQGALNNNGTIALGGQTMMLEEALTSIDKDVTIKDAVIDATNAAPFDEPQLALYLQNANLTLESGTTIIAGEDYGVFGMYVNSVTLEEGSKIIASDGSIAIQIQVMDEVFDLYLNGSGLIEGDTSIVLTTAGTYNFHVPSEAIRAEYENMIVTDGTAQNINWYVNGVLVTE